MKSVRIPIYDAYDSDLFYIVTGVDVKVVFPSESGDDLKVPPEVTPPPNTANMFATIDSKLDEIIELYKKQTRDTQKNMERFIAENGDFEHVVIEEESPRMLGDDLVSDTPKENTEMAALTSLEDVDLKHQGTIRPKPGRSGNTVPSIIKRKSLNPETRTSPGASAKKGISFEK